MASIRWVEKRSSKVVWRRYWAIFALIVCFGVLQAAQAFATDAVAYKLGSGDKLRVTVFGEKDLSGDFDVNDQGVVALPLIGPVSVAGKTLDETEVLITQSYGKSYLVNPRVNVEVLNYRPFYILGEVQKPGSYPYVNGLTVLNAVALAGGYTPRANKDHIVIRRAANPDAGEQSTGEDSRVLPGDVVRVPERFF
jgi:protein involved in polysaccharide export with SLBB domain